MKNKQTVKNKIARTPVIMQLEALECGAACLTMVLAYFDKWIPLEQVRADCGVSRDGSNAKFIARAAESYGLACKGYRFELEDLMQYGTYPCVIHWNFNHFVVLNGFKGNYAYLNDPGRGEVKVSLKEFDKAFTGICLMFEPTESFQPSGKKKSAAEHVLERSRGLGTAMAFVIITTIISSLIGILTPGFTRVFYDRILTGENPQWVTPFLLGLALFSLLQVAVTWIQAVNNYKLNGKMVAVGSTSFMWKLLRLPMNFFSQRMTGDILMRQDSNAAIANTIVNTVAPLALNTVMMIFYFIVMVRYNVVLTVVALTSTLVNLLFSQLISRKRVNATRITLRDSGKLAGMTMAGIEMIETIKASGSENGFFEKWSGYQASANNADIRYARDSSYLNLVPAGVSALTDVIILGIGVYLTMQGQFTLGMITAFQGYLTSFLAPANTLISASQTLQEMNTEIERIDDVMRYPEDPAFSAAEATDGESLTKLTGKIEVKNVSFGYSRLDEPLIQNFSLTVEPGQRVAFVGASGCGKSTLAKLLSGLIQPWSGEILYDGKPIRAIDRAVFTGSLAVVDQDIILFEDSIKKNIKMWDESIEDFEVVLAARDAQIHEDILQRENGYDYGLSEGGKDFSGGQKQRLEIARVLAQDPTICILDEATSALDAKTEYDVIRSIKDRGITCLVVAHRLSTIRDCDEILVLDNGKVVERGKHDDLMKLGGFYTKLITSE